MSLGRSRWAASRLRPDFSRKIQLYGWDGRAGNWYGPNELDYSSGSDQRLFEALRNTPGTSWYGPVNCAAPGGPSNRFFALIHDLGDCIMALIYCYESKAGPAEIVTVIPAERRGRLREEFPFEFLAFTSFLGSTAASVGEEIHSRVAAALAETENSESLVFSIGTGSWAADLEFILSLCVEKVAIAMLRWACEPLRA